MGITPDSVKAPACVCIKRGESPLKQVGQGRAGQGKHTCSARHGMGPVTSGGSSKVQVGRVVRGQGSGTYADWEEQEQRPWWEGGGGRGRARYMAQSSMRGRSRQRAKS